MTARRLALAFALLTAAASAGRAEFVFGGASIGYGTGLAPGQPDLPGGGAAGNFVAQFAQTPAGAARGPYLNGSVGGLGTSATLGNYYGAPHAASPVVAGAQGVAYYATGFDTIFNDTGYLHVATPDTLGTLSVLATRARADGYLVVMLTCPFASNATDPATAAAQNAGIAAVNAAILAHAVPADIIIDTAGWVPPGAQQDPALWQADHIHPTLAGQAILAGRLADFFTTPETVLTPRLAVVGGATVLQADFVRPANRPDLAVTVMESPDLLAWQPVPASRLTTSADGLTVTALADSGMAFLRLQIQ